MSRFRAPGPLATLALLALILALGGYLRLRGGDWDASRHVHPDERYLTMVVSSLALPASLPGYLDTFESPLNPRNRGYEFMTYGTLPVTLVHLIAARLGRTDYAQIHLVGRRVSAMLDLLAVLLVFGLGRELYDRNVGLLAAALAAFTVLHIQQAHFFTVDGVATCCVSLSLFGLARSRRGGRRVWFDLTLAGVGLGLALASKIAVWPLVPVAVAFVTVSEWERSPARSHERWAVARRLGLAADKVVFLGFVSLLVLKLGAPDMFVGHGWSQVLDDPVRFEALTAGSRPAPDWWFAIRERVPDSLEPLLLPAPRWAENMDTIKRQVTGFGMDWPPNHQWWGRKGYWFPWKNMVLWGMGVPLGLAATLGWLLAGRALAKGERRHLLPWLWATVFLALVGIQWAKTLRYFLPVYPALTLLGAWMLVHRPVSWSTRQRGGEHGHSGAAVPRRTAAALLVGVVAGTVLWAFMFTRIYARDHSQIAASDWIYHNVPTAFGVRIAAQDANDATTAWGWLPAMPPPELDFSAGRYRLDDGRWVGPLILRVPPGSHARSAVTVDGVRLAFLRTEDGAETAARARIVLGARTDAAGGPPPTWLARGESAAKLSGAEAPLVVPFDASLPLTTGGEYELWVRIDGAAVAGRTSVLATETAWDLDVPHDLNGYHAFDDPQTPEAEGVFGVERFEMFGDNTSDWFEGLLRGLDRIDYWVSPTNRVYGSVRQLPMRFPQTIAFYDDALFGERFGFRIANDVRSYPNLWRIDVNDQSAEEAFHVYDHPRVVLFERSAAYDPDELRAYLEPLAPERPWRFPAVAERRSTRLLDKLLGRIPTERP